MTTEFFQFFCYRKVLQLQRGGFSGTIHFFNLIFLLGKIYYFPGSTLFFLMRKDGMMEKGFSSSDPRNWFMKKRFGMFVHWGIYAVGGIHEQERWRYQTPEKIYEAYKEKFDPVKFDPVQWLDMFQENGMEYLVFTAKHHDGFCMWDTKETSFNIMNTPYKQDIVGKLAEECHKRDFPFELYYSCVDWHHKAYPNIGRHHEIMTDPAFHDMEEYMAFLKNQIRELCSNYGRIHGIWWDMNVPGYVDPSVHELIRSLQPSAVINNRGYDTGDYSTPERNFLDNGFLPFANLTEACDSVGMNSWAYRKEEDYFSVRKLEKQIALYTALGGNFLLNAGPDPLGVFPEKAKEILHKVGVWYKKVGKALTETPCPGLLLHANHILCTGGGKKLYLTFLEPPAGETIVLEGFSHMPAEAKILNTGKKVAATFEPMSYFLNAEKCLRLREVPVEEMNDEICVMELSFEKDVIKGKENMQKENTGSSQSNL